MYFSMICRGRHTFVSQYMIYILGDMNIDLLKYSKHKKTNDYLDNIFSLGYLPVVTKKIYSLLHE